MREITDSIEIAQRRAVSDRNAARLRAHAIEMYTQNRGKVICIAGEELFVANTTPAAVAAALACHPSDPGMFVRYIPCEKATRIC
jgi:NaMN:DMB phosphoribosyltransferase